MVTIGFTTPALPPVRMSLVRILERSMYASGASVLPTGER